MEEGYFLCTLHVTVSLFPLVADKQVKVWAQDGKQIKALGGFTDLPLEVAFTQDAKRVIVGDWLGSVDRLGY